MQVPFRKMHGCGNDFVLLDARLGLPPIGPEQARAIADRHRGVGCDQLIVIEPSAAGDAFMRIRNPDGSEAGACGNATRCVATLLADETGRADVTIETVSGLLPARRLPGGMIAVTMGTPRFGWADIPLAHPADTLHLPLAAGPLAEPAACSMGNPHATFFVADAATIDLAALGPRLEHAPIFPRRANIGVAQILSTDGAVARIRLRVWERGAGLTLACGSGACAAAVNAVRRGLAPRRVDLVMDGGVLEILWREDDQVVMTGPVVAAFAGVLDLPEASAPR